MASDDLREVSDAALVVAIGRWREDALAEAYRRHAGSVFALARRLLSETGRAEEIVQEVFLRLWHRPERFDPGRGALRSYLLAQTHGRAVDVLRSEGARREREQRDARRTARAGYDVDREVWDLTVSDHVRKVLDGLPDLERQAITLTYFGGYTYRDAAAALGAPEGTVKSRIRSGLKRMRAGLVAAGIAEEANEDR